MNEVRNWWYTHYGVAPIAHLLRQQVSERWLRIHSLPESKRFAETPDEYKVLLKRHNTIATEILGSQTPCVLFVGRYGEYTILDINSQIFPDIKDANFAWFDSVEEELIINIYCAPLIWSLGQFDEIIGNVANDRDACLLFASEVTGEAYAPYAGGADLFLRTAARRNQLQHRYNQWLSTHPQGL